MKIRNKLKMKMSLLCIIPTGSAFHIKYIRFCACLFFENPNRLLQLMYQFINTVIRVGQIAEDTHIRRAGLGAGRVFYTA